MAISPQDIETALATNDNYAVLLSTTVDTDRETIRRSILTGKTPQQFIKKREGSGGKSFDYVEVGYVTRALNLAFMFDWSFKVEVTHVDDEQVVVKGSLTVPLPDTTTVITKEQFGEAKRLRNVPLGDIMKSAASDALKKCASLLGIAGDVYGQLDDSEEEHRARLAANARPQYNRATLEKCMDAYEATYFEVGITPELRAKVEKFRAYIETDNDNNDLKIRAIKLLNEKPDVE